MAAATGRRAADASSPAHSTVKSTAMNAAPLVLASASPRRRELLTRFGVPFTVAAMDVDETPRPDEAPAAYAARLAACKAAAAASGATAGLVLGADTIVVLDGAVLGKPTSPDMARDYLARLRGRRHTVLTALAVVDTAGGTLWTGLEATGVWLRHYAADEVEAYIATGDPLDKAGGYAVQHAGFRPVARLEGSETNVIGLPLGLTARLLARAHGA
jgi:septum formation protein